MIPRCPPIGISCAKCRISDLYAFGTTTWYRTNQSSSAGTSDGLHFLIRMSFFMKYPTGSLSSSSSGRTWSNSRDISESRRCSTASCVRDRGTSAMGHLFFLSSQDRSLLHLFSRNVFDKSIRSSSVSIEALVSSAIFLAWDRVTTQEGNTPGISSSISQSLLTWPAPWLL